ncbi:Delta(8)-fatty-acid desaturase [Hibiscus syriacus]|uniref:Delta(8)-fatty-acid desaturase n=1 Tax=Hibiscus syriacus TaxID=106335 RepID=A0A6A2WSP2_HIBSY|nr:Delta(8)-fatty-acid desaturase [Hibiscus syriacus]
MVGRGYNKLVQLVAGNCLTGISIAWWKWTHNAHHIACNSLDYDPDLQHILFCLKHFSANVYVGPPNGNDWFEKQTYGTLDIECSPWMDWFFGGLQFQLEHHLFPRLSSLTTEEDFTIANRSTVRTLRTAAMEARDLTNPVPKNFLWEAVNTHG